MNFRHFRTIAFIIFFLSSSATIHVVQGQIIAEEFFDEATGSTSGVMSDGSAWLADAPGQCDGSAGIFSVQPTGFVIEDIEGFNCCDCGGGPGSGNCGDNQNIINFNDIDISNGCMVGITVVWSQQGNMECDSPLAPSDVCIGGHDQMVAEYSVDGAPFVQFGYLCGATPVQLPVTGFILSGNSLDIRISAGNQASSETYTLESVVVEGMGVAVSGILSGGGDLCGTNCTTIDWQISGGVAPYDVDFNFIIGAIDIDFTVPSPASLGSIEVCLDPNVPIPFFSPPNTVIINELFGSLATLEMTGISDASGCSVDLTGQIIDINIVDPPPINAIGPIDSICVDVGGSATIDLSIYDQDIDIEGTNTVNWYSDPGLNNPIGPIFMTPTNTTVYATVSSGPGCVTDDIQIQILLTVNPELDTYGPQIACGSFEVPIISGTNLTGNAAFYSEPNGMGTEYMAGDLIFSNTTIYAYDNNNGCMDEEAIMITIFPEPDIDPIIPVLECGFYELPEITGTNLSGSAQYWTLPGGFGDPYNPGDTIYQSIVLYAYDILGTCSDEEFFTIIISQGPEIDMPPIISGCGQVVLPEIEGDNISGDIMYYTEPGGMGNTFEPGDIITETQLLFIYDEAGNCIDEVTININISTGPILDPIPDVTVCAFYELPEITGQNLQNPYFVENNTGNVLQEGDTIFNTGICFIRDSVVGNGLCASELSFMVTVEQNISAGEDINTNSCVGSVINLTNLLDSGVPSNGSFTDLNNTGALINGDTLDLNLSIETMFSLLYVVENICGPDSSLISVSVSDETDAGLDVGNSICEGSIIQLPDYIEGDPGGEFYTEGEIDPIITGIMTDGELGNTIEVIYVVGDGNNCPADTALYQFEVIDQPTFSTPLTVEVCDVYILPTIDGVGLNGDEVYSTLPLNNGTIYETGDTIFSDIKLYLNYDDGNCQAQDSVNIDIKFSTSEDIMETLCPDGSIIVDGEIYDINTPTGQETLMNADGCDSTISINLSFYSTDTNFINSNLCFGESILINGMVYDESNSEGTEIIPNASMTGCDSVIQIMLEFSDAAIIPINDMICSGDSIEINSVYYSESNPNGLDTIQLPSGCDSILDISIGFFQTSTGSLDTIICSNSSIIVNGMTYDIDNPTGVETFDNVNINGCDSLVTVNVTFFSVDDGLITGTLCADESIDTLGVTIDIDNPEEEVVLIGGSSSNCDSTIFISYDFIMVEEGLEEITLCEGASIMIGGEIYDEQNPTGTFTSSTTDGCDSITNVLLTFTEVISDFEVIDADCSDNPTGYLVFDGLNVNSLENFYILDNGDPVNIQIGDTIFGISPGNHDVVFSNEIGCTSSEMFEIMEAEEPMISIPNIVTISEGESYTLENPVDESNTILWTPDQDISCTDCGTPVFSPSVDMDYYLQVTTSDGCIAFDTITIRVEETFNIFFPNTFTPNDDGINDYFNIFPEQEGAYDLHIYDRWGNKVYEGISIPTNSNNNGWDGKKNNKGVSQGVYAYYGIYYKVISPTEVEAIPFQGSVTIFR